VAEKMTTDKKISGGPKIGRREFVKSSTAAVAVATIGPVTLLSSHTANAAESEGFFSNAYFSQRAGEFFQVDAGAGGWNSLELMEVVSSNTSPLLDQFTLRFRGAPSLAIDEGVYDVAPPNGDVFALHIQPTDSDDNGTYYGATFALIETIPVPEPNVALGLLGGAAMLTLLQDKHDA